MSMELKQNKKTWTNELDKFKVKYKGKIIEKFRNKRSAEEFIRNKNNDYFGELELEY